MGFQTELISKRGGRDSNQDCCGFVDLKDAACWVVADGLGGHRGGEVAARLAVDTILTSFRRRPELARDAIGDHLAAAHQAILSAQSERAELEQMRTTAVVLVSDYRSFLFGYAGDSRFYHFRGGRIRLQSRDHSVPQVLADAGDISADEIRSHPDTNRLLRALGMEGELRPEVLAQKQSLEDGDTFLLCVDGFWQYVLETEMEADLARTSDVAAWLSGMELRILNRAPGGHDNYTAVAISFTGESGFRSRDARYRVEAAARTALRRLHRAGRKTNVG